VRRLLLVRHAATSATRVAGFPADEPLDGRGRVEAGALAGALPARATALSSPALRCRQTAAAAGVDEPHVVAALAECDFGMWAGRTLADVAAASPADVAAWMEDPDARPHGGESLSAFATRVGDWLDGEAACDGQAVAFTHGGVVKAALVHALGAPLAAFWRIDVMPLSITELHAHDGRWTIARVNCAVAASDVGSRRAGRAAARATPHAGPDDSAVRAWAASA
jgi:broad specificity phosphatase PhoE